MTDKRRGMGSLAASFAVLFGFWVVLSGHLDAFHLGAGALCSGLVAARTHRLLRPGPPHPLRLLGYLPWLLWQIALANLHVARLALSPRMPIRPRLVEYRTSLEGLALVAFANSITLTPGTITVEASPGQLLVHALSDQAARDLRSGEMERRVRRAFG